MARGLPTMLATGMKDYTQIKPGDGADGDGTAMAKVVDFELIPPGAVMTVQDIDLFLVGYKSDLNPNQYFQVMLDCWVLPLGGTLADNAPQSLLSVTAYYNMLVGKIIDLAPRTTANDDWTITDAQARLGDIDNAVRWDPHRISLRVLEGFSEPHRLYSHKIRLGAPWGNVWRDSPGKMRYMYQEDAIVSNGVQAPPAAPVIVVWVLSIPADIDASEWPIESLFPAGGRWESWDFLSPVVDFITGSVRVADSTVNTWRKWVMRHYSDDDIEAQADNDLTNAAGNDYHLWTPSSFSFHMDRSVAYPRSAYEQSVIGASQT